MSSDVTVVIPTIPPRRSMLERAVRSVTRQQHPAAGIVISNDLHRRGAAVNRDAGLHAVRTPLVAFLDDDDEMYPHHLAALMEAQRVTGADLVYPWFDVGSGGTDPFPLLEGVPWDNENPHQVPITFLARTELLTDLGGFSYAWDPTQGEDPGTDPDGNRAGEDYRMILRVVAAGGIIHHHPERTWLWHHHSANTSGLPSRW